MEEIVIDALKDSLGMIPFLLAIYVGIEIFEYRFGKSLRQIVQRAGVFGPLIGAIVGCFPQCGFSVIITALFTQRLVTIGTLLAVYISTSDEAIPVILSQPEKSYIILPLLLTKICIAIIAGYLIDFVFRKQNRKILHHINEYSTGKDDNTHHHESVLENSACCGHSVDSSAKKFNIKEIIFHPIIHTGKIFGFIFVITFLINFFIYQIGEDNIGNFLADFKILQPIFAATIGLIPNCAASVAIAELYLKGLIAYGSAIAGLSAGAGLGLLVLFKEEKNKKNIFLVLFLLLFTSISFGMIINYFNILNL